MLGVLALVLLGAVALGFLVAGRTRRVRGGGGDPDVRELRFALRTMGQARFGKASPERRGKTTQARRHAQVPRQTKDILR